MICLIQNSAFKIPINGIIRTLKLGPSEHEKKFCIFINELDTREACTLVKIIEILKWVHYVVSKLYLIETVLQKMIGVL